jgi:hypothetical protein
MGTAKKGHHVYLIDFGLAKKYRDHKTHVHIQYKENKQLTGTARYASVNTHLGIEQSRRDDLESIAYVLVYFMKGTLPWQGLKAATKMQKYERISEKKMSTPVEQLCKDLPAEFASFLNYARSLRFEDKPDYNFVRSLFRELFARENFVLDYVFDWTAKKMNEQQQQDQGEPQQQQPEQPLAEHVKNGTSPTTPSATNHTTSSLLPSLSKDVTSKMNKLSLQPSSKQQQQAYHHDMSGMMMMMMDHDHGKYFSKKPVAANLTQTTHHNHSTEKPSTSSSRLVRNSSRKPPTAQGNNISSQQQQQRVATGQRPTGTRRAPTPNTTAAAATFSINGVMYASTPSVIQPTSSYNNTTSSKPTPRK